MMHAQLTGDSTVHNYINLDEFFTHIASYISYNSLIYIINEI